MTAATAAATDWAMVVAAREVLLVAVATAARTAVLAVLAVLAAATAATGRSDSSSHLPSYSDCP